MGVLGHRRQGGDKEGDKKKKMEGKMSEDIAPETDQALQFNQTMDAVNGFNLQAIGGGGWDGDEDRASASSFNRNVTSDHTETVVKRKKLTDEQKRERKIKTLQSMVNTTVKDVDAALYNNGKVLRDSKKSKLVAHRIQLLDVIKDVDNEENHRDILAAIKEAKADVNKK